VWQLPPCPKLLAEERQMQKVAGDRIISVREMKIAF
jgi:hypothetical protein